MNVFNAMFSKVNGGLEQVFLNYIPALEQQGNRVIPVIHPKAEIHKDCAHENLRTVHNFNQYDFFAIHKLKKLIKKEQADCIITHSYRAAYLFKKTKVRVPKIAVCHVQGHYNFGSDAIIAITEPMRQDIIKSGFPAEKVFTVPNMIRAPAHLTYKAPRHKKVPTIGVCARFVSMKGIDVFLAALAELKSTGQQFRAEIAGDGPQRAMYTQLISEYKLEQQVTLLGWVNERDKFYSNLDIFCLPSRIEAFGLVILEAMMHSLPVVLTDLPGPREVIADSGSALFSPAEDFMGLANNLAAVMNDKHLANTLSLNAFNRGQNYSVSNVSPVLHNVIEKVCANYPF